MFLPIIKEFNTADRLPEIDNPVVTLQSDAASAKMELAERINDRLAPLSSTLAGADGRSNDRAGKFFARETQRARSPGFRDHEGCQRSDPNGTIIPVSGCLLRESAGCFTYAQPPWKDWTMEPSAPEAKDLFKVQLDAFEGPLDLLLALIQKNEMDIFNVRLAKITEDYLTYIGLAQHYDLDLAGDYLVVAATLLLMKSRALIPREETEEEIEEDDPELLAQRLEEYKQFKAVADALRERELVSRDRHFLQTEAYKQLGDSLDFYDLNIYDLYTAFKTILAEIGDTLPGVIQDEDWTVDEKMVELQELLERSGRIKLTDYLRGMKAKLEVIVTFLAMLELIRMKRLAARQMRSHGEIWIMTPQEAVTGEHPRYENDPKS
jgi:segregation and condensation protein A